MNDNEVKSYGFWKYHKGLYDDDKIEKNEKGEFKVKDSQDFD